MGAGKSKQEKIKIEKEIVRSLGLKSEVKSYKEDRRKQKKKDKDEKEAHQKEMIRKEEERFSKSPDLIKIQNIPWYKLRHLVMDNRDLYIKVKAGLNENEKEMLDKLMAAQEK